MFGGTSVNKNRQDLARGVDILVATPGRLIDLIEQRFLTLSDVEILVLDEADQMLDLGFIHALKQIVRLLPAKRQTLFFSATMPKAIKELADKFLTDPAQVAVAPAATTVERVEQYVTFVQQAEKQALLTMMLRDGFSERGKMDRVLIFTRTKHGADRVVKLLAGNGIAANAIHGNKSQPQRERALAEFKAGQGQDPDRDRHRRARHRRLGRQPRHQLRAAQRRRAICPPHRPHRARRRGGRRDRLLRRGRAGLSQGHREADPAADRSRAAAGEFHRRGQPDQGDPHRAAAAARARNGARRSAAIAAFRRSARSAARAATRRRVKPMGGGRRRGRGPLSLAAGGASC